MLLYAGYMECTVHLLAGMPVCYIYRQQEGTAAEPPHGRKDFRMKRAELDRRIANGETLEDIVPVLMDDGADITSYDDLKRFAIEKIESDELYLAEHVLKACLDVADYYGYDYSMGTLENPTAIDGVEDLIDYVED
jgi:hypothetical protein